MADVREITTSWTLPSGAGHVAVMYFDAAVSAATSRNFLNTFWVQLKAFQSTGTAFLINTTGRTMDAASGTLTGAWVETTPYTGVGAAGSVSVPDATQALIQWRTTTIVAGRFLRGRQYIPGLGIGHTSGGNVLPATVTAITNSGNTLAASGAGLQVWHRPVAGSGGSMAAVTGATTWSEFAVLRRRRG